MLRYFTNYNIVLITIIGIITIFFVSCDCMCSTEDCEQVACTEQFVTITVTILDQDLNPFVFDDFKVYEIENNIDLTRNISEYEWQYIQEHGIYPLFGDEYQATYQNTELEIQFVGILNGEQKLVENFIVGADCCHVYAVSGNFNITFE